MENPNSREKEQAREGVVRPSHAQSMLKGDIGDYGGIDDSLVRQSSAYSLIGSVKINEESGNKEAKSNDDENDNNSQGPSSSFSSSTTQTSTSDDDDDQIVLYDVDEEGIMSEKHDCDGKANGSNDDKTNGAKEQQYNTYNDFQIGFLQIMALLRKNFLTKRRTPTGTFFELFSPLLMMLILAAAFSLSEITYKAAKQYTTTTFDFPGPWLDLLQTFQQSQNNSMDDFIDGGDFEQRNRRRRRGLWDVPKRLLRDDADHYGDDVFIVGDPLFATSDDNDWNDVLTGLQDRVHRLFLDQTLMSDDGRRTTQKNDYYGRALQFDDDDDSIDRTSDSDDDGKGNIYDFLNDARKQVNFMVIDLLSLLPDRKGVGRAI